MSAPTVTFGEIVAKDQGVEILEAPEFALLSLDLLASPVSRMTVHLGLVHFGYRDGKPITYEVIGWDGDHAALQLQRVGGDV